MNGETTRGDEDEEEDQMEEEDRVGRRSCWCFVDQKFLNHLMIMCY